MADDWTISASKIKAHERCEEEFRLRYIEGKEEKAVDPRFIRRGNAVHEAIERIIQITAEPSDVTASMLKGAYHNNGGQEGYRLSDEFHSQVLASFDAVERYFANYVDEVRGVEVEVEFSVDRATITRDFGGFMDLATQDAVVDWKTGKSEGKEAGEAIQGAVYMAGYYDEYGRPPARIQYAYVNPEAQDDHPKVRTIEPDDDLWEEMIGKATKLLQNVKNDSFTPDPAPSKCNFCDYEVFCGASPVGAGNIEWGSYP